MYKRQADRHPRPYSLAAGMCFTLLGLFTLSVAPGFVPILLAVGSCHSAAKVSASRTDCITRPRGEGFGLAEV